MLRMNEDLPADLVDNDLFLNDKMDLNRKVKKRTKLKDYKAVLTLLKKNEKQLRNLRKSDRTSELPANPKSQIDTSHKKVNSTLTSVAERFELEYGMKPFEWLDEIG
jgi:hypothetical protein